MQNSIDIVKEYVDYYDFKPSIIYDKHFLNGTFHITKIYNAYNLKFYVYDYTYADKKCILNRDYFVFTKLFNDIYILTTNDELYYCSINDYLYINKEEYDKRDRNCEVHLTLRNLLEECCVCNTNNIVKTSCNHNLCRICFNKCIKQEYCNKCDLELEDIICCPLCRRELYKDCKLSYLN